MSLTLDVFEIARTRQTVEGTLELDEMPELAHFIQALEGFLKFSVTGLGIVERLPAASLSFEGTVVMQCARCNEPGSVPVSRAGYRRQPQSLRRRLGSGGGDPVASRHAASRRLRDGL